MRDLEQLFAALAKSAFRGKFRLQAKEMQYLRAKGLPTIRQHALDFVGKRLAPAVIPNGGKQTPYRGHPVFVAQHATACCCRGCLRKWHGIGQGRALSDEEQHYIVEVLLHWLRREMHRVSDA
ncbi:DUF4186 domain-containing protein [Methylomonas rivi]|uniref:DUF4186 domain-containing protein n=1 Tax=Methylomonas rivi TaxID=2952226 RepID=A0ABT1U7U6_9GAMM|nr:DUF4186 domain-containing protein [Methylomonas sp. WSC-6]